MDSGRRRRSSTVMQLALCYPDFSTLSEWFLWPYEVIHTLCCSFMFQPCCKGTARGWYWVKSTLLLLTFKKFNYDYIALISVFLKQTYNITKCTNAPQPCTRNPPLPLVSLGALCCLWKQFITLKNENEQINDNVVSSPGLRLGKEERINKAAESCQNLAVWLNADPFQPALPDGGRALPQLYTSYAFIYTPVTLPITVVNQ